MQQTGDNEDKGEYVNNNVGMRMGGYVVASYGGKIVPCLADDNRAPAPWGEQGPDGGPKTIAERAMDLTIEQADVRMIVANGQYRLSSFSGVRGDLKAPAWIDLAFAVADAAIVLSGQELRGPVPW
jgi:hypothetical protein